MAGFDEQIVREYFELQGFMVRQWRKYQTPPRKKLPEEEIDLLVMNPNYVRGGRDPGFMLFASELRYVPRAVVAVRGWHTTQHFTPRLIQSSSEIAKFLERDVLKSAEDFFGPSGEEFGGGNERLFKILVLPGLPTAEPHRSDSVRLLRERGVDAVISFRSMLADIISMVEINRNYSKSDLLQIIRILKIYDLVKDPQLALFTES
ncbi:MAG: hypothetical protein WC360_04145 [Opitutales bacterium]|jgi:hypothetical protein